MLAAIALGSNLDSRWGDREGTMRESIRRLGGLGTVRAVSQFIETKPVGYLDQPMFLNGALLLETGMEPLELLRGLLGIERAMGRDRAGVVAKGPRVIDLDLLLLGDLVMETPELTLPHPAITQRRFVLQPLAEIAPGMREPVSGLMMRELLERLAGGAGGEADSLRE